MVKFRRSIKSDAGSGKHDSAKPVQIAIPQKDAIAIEPPKKVIKALYDWSAPSDQPPHYLSFSAGDFLHVVSREDDANWYEACNPLQGARGLVPVGYFDTVGKTARESADSIKSGSATHDSGYAEGSQTPARSTGTGTSRSSALNGGAAARQSEAAVPPMPMPGHRVSKSMGKSGGVYGVVSYDFHAERPDELEAKEGEAIIVIAQSNPEWFVAKPITRLGGPGLIPVSFIEIRDMTTGRAVEDPVAAVQKAGIPRVEEWKKMAAEYKNTSIPLGSVSSSQQQQQNLADGMGRMSLSSAQHQQQNNGYGHERSPSNYAYQQQQQQNLFAPVRASVPKYIFADDKFHFIVECKLSNNTHWDLSRIYEDFYELQINLINAFPAEAGQVSGQARTLPYMPGPVKFVTDNISEGRRENLDQYLRELLAMPQHITACSLVRNFFSPRDNDYEVDPSNIDLNDHARPTDSQQQQQPRYSQASQHSYSQSQPNNYPLADQQYPLQPHSRQGSVASVQHHPQQQAYTHQRGAASLSAPPTNPQQSHYRSPSEYTSHSGSHSTTARSAPSPAPTSHGAGGQVKVKAWFDRDTCVVLRLPARGAFDFASLYQKIVDRRKLEFKNGELGADEGGEDDLLDIEYRDERDGEYYRLEGDEDLEIALERNEKLTLAVRAAGT